MLRSLVGSEMCIRDSNKIVALTNSLGLKTGIVYAPLSGSDHYTYAEPLKTSEVSGIDLLSKAAQNQINLSLLKRTAKNESLYEGTHSNPWQGYLGVVTRTYSNTGMPADENFNVRSYYRHDARREHNGRGFLGFSAIKKVQESNSQIDVALYRHDWPHTGKSYLSESGIEDKSLNLYISLHSFRTRDSDFDENWLAAVDTQGSSSIGPVEAYLETHITKNYGDSIYEPANTSLVLQAQRDGFANPLKIRQRGYIGEPFDSRPFSEKLTENSYHEHESALGNDYIRRYGRVRETKTTTSAFLAGASANLVGASAKSTERSTYDYYDQGQRIPFTGPGGNTYYSFNGMQSSKVVYRKDSDQVEYEERRYYDLFGNRVLTYRQNTGETFALGNANTYDQTGRYIDKNHAYVCLLYTSDAADE